MLPKVNLIDDSVIKWVTYTKDEIVCGRYPLNLWHYAVHDIDSDEEDGSLNVNPNSLTVLKECYLEPSFDDAKAYDSYQFVRHGFFCVDAKDSRPDALVFNRIVSLKSSFKLPK